MGNDCFNWNNKEKDLFVNKKPLEEQEDDPFQAISQVNTYRKNISNVLNEPSLAHNKNYNSFFPNNSNGFNYNNNPQIPTLGKRSNSLKIIDAQKPKRIHKFTREELEDEINDILRIRIPFFENDILKTISAFTFLSGNGPYHEGLMFFTTNKNFYIAQSYPITFVKVYDFHKGISEIVSFNNINKKAKKYSISEIYCPQEPITLYDVLNIINNLPNKYNLLNENCQDFCNNVLEILNKKFKIEIENGPNITKINFLKMQKKIKPYCIPNNKPYYNSGRFDNL